MGWGGTEADQQGAPAVSSSIRSQAHALVTHVHPSLSLCASLTLSQPPHAFLQTSPASLPPGLPLTPIYQSCHCFDNLLFCCQINGLKTCIIMATFIYKGSLKLPGLAFKVVQKCGPTELFSFTSPSFQMCILVHVSPCVCSFLPPHRRLLLCPSCSPLSI